MGKKVIAHHTLLTCSGQDTPSEKPEPVSHREGEVIWAQAPSLPAWPGRILAADNEVPMNKVGMMKRCRILFNAQQMSLSRIVGCSWVRSAEKWVCTGILISSKITVSSMFISCQLPW